MQNRSHMMTLKRSHTIFLIGAFLVLSTVAVYWQVAHHEFISLDDSEYITDNTHVKAGVTFNGIVWAVTSVDAANWHPLTWISHMLDVELFGMHPGSHLLVNLFLHIINTLLLFWVLYQMTGNLWPSSIVAALFALHPLHVESVAWASERKDVLSTFFWMLTLYAYLRYVKQPRSAGYLTVVLLFLLGLLAKQMLVTLPFVMLLLDYWPLGRFKSGGTAVGSGAFDLLREKIPLIGLSAAASMATWIAQSSRGAIYPLHIYPVTIRLGNASISYVRYVWKTFWPYHLSGFYPHPRATLSGWEAIGCGLILLLISICVIRSVKQYPFLLVGWFWYLGTLVPVIGLVQVGAQAMADRYTYVPLIGLFIMLAWGLERIVRSMPAAKPVLIFASGIIGIGLMTATWVQVGHWRSSKTFFQHMLRVTSDNYVGYNGLGGAMEKEGNMEEAIRLYSEAIRILPNYVLAHFNLANAFTAEGKLQPAIDHYRKILAISPFDGEALNNLGIALVKAGDYDVAIQQFTAAVKLNPRDLKLFNNLGVARFHKGEFQAAATVFRYVLSRASESQTAPVYAHAAHNLKIAVAVQKRIQEKVETSDANEGQRLEFTDSESEY